MNGSFFPYPSEKSCVRSYVRFAEIAMRQEFEGAGSGQVA
jgi:hypothetical protein